MNNVNKCCACWYMDLLRFDMSEGQATNCGWLWVIFCLLASQTWYETGDSELKLAATLCMDIDPLSQTDNSPRLMKCRGERGSQEWLWSIQVRACRGDNSVFADEAHYNPTL